jgi:hypothetical protein
MKDDDRYVSIQGWTTNLGPGDLLVIPSRWLDFVETIDSRLPTAPIGWMGQTGVLMSATVRLSARGSLLAPQRVKIGSIRTRVIFP